MAFAPTDISGLALWLKSDTGVYSDAGSTPATNGGTVQQWNDQSGNVRHVSQTTSTRRPTYVTNLFNGLPGLRFDGTDDFLDQTYNGATLPISIVCVFRLLSNQAGQVRGVVTMDKPGQFGQSLGYDSSERLQCEVKSAFHNSPNVMSLNSIQPTIAVWSGTAGGPANVTAWIAHVVQLYRNYISGTPNNDAGLNIGTYDDSVTFAANIEVAEVMVYEAGLTSADRANLWSYLDARYNTSAAPITLLRYFLPGFYSDTDESAYVLTSSDGATFNHVPLTYSPSLGTVRDTQYFRYNSRHWLMHTSGSFGNSSSWGLASALPDEEDALNFTAVANVDCSSVSGANRVWGPKPFVDPVDLSLHALVAISTSGSGGPFTQYEQHPTSTDLTTWSNPVAITGTGLPSNMIDGFEFYSGGTYYIIVKDEDTKFIVLLSSSSPFSGFTVLKSGDWMGIGQAEGCSIVRMGSTWRVYFDDYLSNHGGGMCYVESSSLNFNTATWGAVVNISAPYATRNGGVYDRNTALEAENPSGAVVDGTAVYGLVFANTGTGGSVVAGTGNELAIHIVAVDDGAVANGSAIEHMAYALNVSSAGGLASGNAALSVSYRTSIQSVGAWASGSADVAYVPAATATYDEIMSGGVRVLSAGLIAVFYDATNDSAGVLVGSESVNGVINPTHLTYHRFEIGDMVYVLTIPGGSYRGRQVMEIFRYGTQVFYRFGTDEFVAEQFVLSLEDYQALLGRLAGRIRKDAQRNLSRLKDLPLN